MPDMPFVITLEEEYNDLYGPLFRPLATWTVTANGPVQAVRKLADAPNGLFSEDLEDDGPFVLRVTEVPPGEGVSPAECKQFDLYRSDGGWVVCPREAGSVAIHLEK